MSSTSIVVAKEISKLYPFEHPKAYSYVRFSTRHQAKGDSLHRQLDRSREYAAENNLLLQEKSFEDLGVSAFDRSNATKGALAGFIQAVESGAIERGSFLLVENLDRLSRADLFDAMALLAKLVKLGIRVVTLIDKRILDEESIKDQTSLIWAVMVFIRANEESATKSDRVKKAHQRKRDNGSTFAFGQGPGWLRERAIGPSKAKGYLDEIVLQKDEPLYGMIFAAACDFSKKTRDGIFEWCRANGISEVHIWGRGELEDMLFQPKNDNLLFAYFGISLVIRQRSLATQLRAELATKRKLSKTVATSSAEILVRDPAASDYPRVEKGKRPTQWWVYQPEQLTHLGLMVSIRWHYAYVDAATGEWDAAHAVTAMPGYHPWRVEDAERDELDSAARSLWDAFPEQNKGWLKISGFIPFRTVVAIDELGDDVFNGTHVYVPFHPTKGPFDGRGYSHRLSTTSRYDGEFDPAEEKRVRKFDKRLRVKD